MLKIRYDQTPGCRESQPLRFETDLLRLEIQSPVPICVLLLVSPAEESTSERMEQGLGKIGF
jgi:hypothetical protein